MAVETQQKVKTEINNVKNSTTKGTINRVKIAAPFAEVITIFYYYILCVYIF